MMNQVNMGALLAALGGIFLGVSALVTKRAESQWRWKNAWLLFSIVGLLVCPGLAVWLSLPSLRDVAQTAPFSSTALVALCGLAWGVGIILFRHGLNRAGMALGLAIFFGVSSPFGALLPLLALDSTDVSGPRSASLLASVALGIVGIVLLSVAVTLRDTEKSRRAGLVDPGVFRTGVLLCLASGALSSALNFAFVFGKPLQEAALVFGAREDVASCAIWAPALAGALLPNVIYELFRLKRNKTGEKANVSGSSIRGWLGTLAAGLLLYGGIGLYGMGATAMGPLGAMTGWPVFISTAIIITVVAGFMAGEWNRAGAGTRALLSLALCSLAAAPVFAAMAGQL